jgi:ADP-ribosyl-[dinitrogen reductase] hydrolase
MKKVERSIWGFIYGDAFGVPVEFLARDTFSIQTFEGYGSWPVPAGTWSDDSAMMFVTMDHLIRNTSMDDLKRAFCDWKYRGFWTFDHEPSFDVGITISEILERWEHMSLNEKAKSDELSNGNGALMRILPIAFYTYSMSEEKTVKTIQDYASLTHGHIRSTLCSVHYCKVVHALLDGKSLLDAMELANDVVTQMLEDYSYEKSIFDRLSEAYQLPRDEIESSGYVVHTLEAVYWSLANSENYYDAIHKAVHLGKDTDTIAALTGGLAGLMYGQLNVPNDWPDQIPRRSDIEQLITHFNQLIE